MFQEEVKVRVRYSETDKMGYVYYGNYAAYFEVARVELLRNVGMSYKAMEDEGIMMPVVDFHMRYMKPAFYDDELVIKTKIIQLPTSKIEFIYETYNQQGELLNIAETILVFVNMESGRPCRPPEVFIQKIAPYFK